MATFSVVYFVLLGIAVSLQSASAIECYRCTPSDSNCKDPFDTKAGVNKESCAGYCFKMKLGSSSSDIHRRCVVGSRFGLFWDDTTINGFRNQTTTCSTDLCNSVLPMGGSFIVMVASFIIYYVLF